MAEERRIQSILSRLSRQISEKEYYSAQQLIGTLCSRYSRSGRLDDAIILAEDGAYQLLCAGEATSGCQIATEFIAFMERAMKEEVSSESIPRIERLLDAGKISDTYLGAFIGFLKRALKYSKKYGEFADGNPRLHARIAELYARDKSDPDNFVTACDHFICSDEAAGFGRALIAYVEEDLSSPEQEYDLVIAHAVLRYLGKSNLGDANIVFKTFCSHKFAFQARGVEESARNDKCLPPGANCKPSPLLHFVFFLLFCLEFDAPDFFAMLCTKYQPALRRHEDFEKLLDTVGRAFFNLEPQSSQPAASPPVSGNDFLSMLGNMFEGGSSNLTSASTDVHANRSSSAHEDDPLEDVD